MRSTVSRVLALLCTAAGRPLRGALGAEHTRSLLSMIHQRCYCRPLSLPVHGPAIRVALAGACPAPPSFNPELPVPALVECLFAVKGCIVHPTRDPSSTAEPIITLP